MFEGWENYYLAIGPSAAALIGLMFVVITLTAGRDRKEVERGKHLYTSPIVWHLGTVLFLSGAASAPTMNPRLFGSLCIGLGLIGLGMGIRSTIGIARVQLSGTENNLFDAWWYGAAPGLACAGLAAAGVGVFLGTPWGTSALAAALMALLLISIHAEWDLVTFLAPAAEPPNSATKPD